MLEALEVGRWVQIWGFGTEETLEVERGLCLSKVLIDIPQMVEMMH